MIAIEYGPPDIRVKFYAAKDTQQYAVSLTEILGRKGLRALRADLALNDTAIDRFETFLQDLFERWLAEKPHELLNIDSSALMHSLRLALAAKNFSAPEGERWPQTDLTTSSRKLKAVAQVKPDPVEEEPYLKESDLIEWKKQVAQVVMAMDDLTADVLDFISDVWLEQADHHGDMVTITADEFLRSRDLTPKMGGAGRRGGYHDSQRREFGRQIGVLSNTWIRVFERDVTELAQGKKGPYRKQTKWAGESRAVVVSSRVGPTTPAGGLDPYAWRIRPGDVFTKFLLGPGRQTALISHKALRYDPYRQKWEKRLTRYLAYIWRIRQSRRDYAAPFAVRALLQGIGQQVDKNDPKRTKGRMAKALDQLQQDGVIAAWNYESANEAIVGQRGWWKDWLNWKVVIEPPSEITAHYAQIQLPMPERKALPAPGGKLDG